MSNEDRQGYISFKKKLTAARNAKIKKVKLEYQIRLSMWRLFGSNANYTYDKEIDRVELNVSNSDDLIVHQSADVSTIETSIPSLAGKIIFNEIEK